MPRLILPPAASFPYDATPAPQSTLDALALLGYDVVSVSWNTSSANQALLSRPCSDAQLALLKKYNYDTTSGATVGQYEAAMRVIQRG